MNKISIACIAVLGASWLAVTSGCKKTAADCAAALDNAMKVSKDDMKGIDAKLAAKIKETSLARCSEDKWSDAVLKCFSEAKTGPALGDCENMKTQDQRDKLAKAIAALADPGSGSAEAGSDQGSGSAGSGSAGSGSSGSAAGSGSAHASVESTVNKAEQAANDAVKTAKDTAQSVERLAHDAEELDKKIGGAVDAVIAAQTDADRATAKAKLDQLRKEKQEIEQRVQAAKAEAAKAARAQGTHISKECLDNPLAKGCS